jgi:hypothetical protein
LEDTNLAGELPRQGLDDLGQDDGDDQDDDRTAGLKQFLIFN